MGSKQRNKVKECFENGEWYEFFKEVRELFSGLIANEETRLYEKLFGIIFTAILNACHIMITPQIKTELGHKAGGFIETVEYVFIFEYQLFDCQYEYMDRDQGIRQILERHYETLKVKNKPTYLVGINFQYKCGTQGKGNNLIGNRKRRKQVAYYNNGKDLINRNNIDNFVIKQLSKTGKKCLSQAEGWFDESKKLFLNEYSPRTGKVIKVISDDD